MVPVFPPSCYFGPAKTHWPYITTGGPPIEKEKKRLFPQRSRGETIKRLQGKLSRAKKQIPVNDKTTHKAGYTEDELIAIFETEDESSKKKRQRNKRKAIRKKRKKMEQKQKMLQNEEKSKVKNEIEKSGKDIEEKNIIVDNKDCVIPSGESEKNSSLENDFGETSSQDEEKICEKKKEEEEEEEEKFDIIPDSPKTEELCDFVGDIRSASQDSGNMSEDLNLMGSTSSNEGLVIKEENCHDLKLPEEPEIKEQERCEEMISKNIQNLNALQIDETEWTVVSTKRKPKKTKKNEEYVKSNKSRRKNKEKDSSGNRRRKKRGNKGRKDDQKKSSNSKKNVEQFFRTNCCKTKRICTETKSFKKSIVFGVLK